MTAASEPTESAETDERIAHAWRLAGAGRRSEAEGLCRAVLQGQPGHPRALAVLGEIALLDGERQRALGWFSALVEAHPRDPRGPTGQGRVCRVLRRFGEAFSCFERALALRPDDAAVLLELGECHLDAGAPDQALPVLQRAVALDPGVSRAWLALGNALLPQDRNAAEDAIRRAVSLDPGFARAHRHLGNLRQGAGDLDGAVKAYRRAGAAAPADPAAHANLATVEASLGRHQNALSHLRRAAALAPWSSALQSNLLFAMTQDPELAPEEVFAAHLAYGRRFGGRASPEPHRNSTDPCRRLRIGYVSGDFCRHTVADFIEPVLASHDRGGVDVYCYAEVPEPDEVTARIRAIVPHWRSIVGASDDKAAAQIKEDGIDILVDLSGHTARNRLPVFARKPAPVQISWLGYPNTTGLREIDYRLIGRPVWSADLQALFAERLVAMPVSACYRPVQAPEPGAAPARRLGAVTFGSFNAPSKLNDKVLALWAALLAKVPGSRLVLRHHGLDGPAAAGRLRARFTAVGGNPDRIQCRGYLPFPEYLAAHGEIDIGLDPFPYEGGTTTRNALWMGVPVVTLTGRTLSRRVGTGLLRAVGLEACIAETPEDYIRKASALADDLDGLQRLRADLRPRLSASPLFDPPAFTADLERTYRRLWVDWCAQHGADRRLRR